MIKQKYWKRKTDYSIKNCPECKQQFIPRTYAQNYCSKRCCILGKEKLFRKNNGMWVQVYRRLKRKYGGNEGVLIYLNKQMEDLNKSISFIKSGGKVLKSDENWNWKINRKAKI